MSSSDDSLYYNPRRTIAVWCWAQMDASMEGVFHLLYLLTTRNLWNAEIPPHLQGWGPGYHLGGGSLFLERMWLYHAAMILHLVHDLSDPWLILQEGRHPGQVWPGVLRLLRNFFFPEQPTRSPPPVPSRRAAPTQPIYIVTLPTIIEVSSDEELFGYSPRSTDHHDALTSVTSDSVSDEREDSDVEEEELLMIFGPMSSPEDHSLRLERMVFADEDLDGSVLPLSPELHPPHMIVSLDEWLSRPMSPRRANPVMIITFPDDDLFAPIPPVEISEVVNEVDHFPPLPPVVITEIFNVEVPFPPLPPVTGTEIFPEPRLGLRFLKGWLAG